MVTGRDRIETFIVRNFWILWLAILLLAFGFRLPGLATRSLWIDELFSQWFAARSFAELWQDVPRYETHPPFYYMLLRAWSLVFGSSELALRSLSLTASLATVGLLGLSGRMFGSKAFGMAAGLVAAALLASNFANIRDAQNVRPYALQALFATLAVLSALVLVDRLSRSMTARGREGWLGPALLLGLSAGLSLWLHNTSIFICAGLWIGLFATVPLAPAGHRLRQALVFAAAGIVALAVWAPYLPTYLAQMQAFSGLAFWLNPKARDLYSAWMLLFGESFVALAQTLLLLALGLGLLFRRLPALALVCTAVLLLPLAAMLAISFSIKPVYIQRLFAWMVPLAFLVMASGLVRLRPPWVALALAVLAFGLGSARSVADFARPIDDWKAIVGEIAAHARPGDTVIAVPAEGSIALGYYAARQKDFPPILCIPGCYPQRGLERTYYSNFGAPEIIAADREMLDATLSGQGRIWLVQVSIALYDPKSQIRNAILSRRRFVSYFGNALAKVELFE